MVDGLMRDLSTTLSPILMERLAIRLSPKAGEGWGDGIFRTMLTLFAALFSIAAAAEELPDPTRPPASIAAPVIAASGVAGSSSPVLQSIIISKTRRAAIIGGETVELGGKYGDAKLIEVNEGSVILRSAQGRQVMSLFPDVKITAAKVPAGNEEQKVKSRLPSPISKAQPERQKANQAATGEKK